MNIFLNCVMYLTIGVFSLVVFYVFCRLGSYAVLKSLQQILQNRDKAWNESLKTEED